MINNNLLKFAIVIVVLFIAVGQSNEMSKLVGLDFEVFGRVQGNKQLLIVNYLIIV